MEACPDVGEHTWLGGEIDMNYQIFFFQKLAGKYNRIDLRDIFIDLSSSMSRTPYEVGTHRRTERGRELSQVHLAKNASETLVFANNIELR